MFICALAVRLVALLQTVAAPAPTQRQQSYPADDGRGYAAAASAEVDLRPEASGPPAWYAATSTVCLFSGKPLDAFPSGHAIHVGALASAATVLPPAKRYLVWSIGAGLVLTRIVLLAHWTSDVIAGLAIGAAVERLARRWTGFGLSRRDIAEVGSQYSIEPRPAARRHKDDQRRQPTGATPPLRN